MIRWHNAARLGLIGIGLCWSGAALAAPITLKSGLKITGSAVVRPGEYRLDDSGGGIVQVSGRNFTVDFRGARLVGGGANRGIGIHITDARNITIKNADVSRYLWGIVVERSVGVRLVNCTASRNGDLPPGTVIDESGREPEDNHGGGIILRDSRRCRVDRCTAQYQWDGIDVVRSEGNVIQDGDYSYNGNWGLHLWNASRNIFRRNRAVWCTTGGGALFQALTGWQTYDAQAVGIDHNSNENRIEDNDLRFGGDGIFIRANEGPIAPGTVVPPKNGSHRNILRNNDCSFSPNNAIEVDLVDDTLIEGNNCSYSHYGMWLGYSRRCVVRDNIAVNCTAHAVEIENGQGDVFERNVFGYDAPREASLVYLRQNGRDKTPSGPYTFRNNLFYGARKAIELRATSLYLDGNLLAQPSTDSPIPQMVVADAASRVTGETQGQRASQMPAQFSPPQDIRAGSPITLSGSGLRAAEAPPVVEVEGIPAWVRRATDRAITFWMPADLWDRPARDVVRVRVLNGDRWSQPMEVPVSWPPGQPRIDGITPNPAHLGETVTITGHFLSGRLLFNNAPVPELTRQRNGDQVVVTAKLPEGILTPTRYNVLFEQRNGTVRRTWPVTFAVEVPSAQMPHLVSATFSPTRLRVGDLLKVTLVVRNNLPHPAPLMMAPKPPFTYEEKQAWWELGVQEVPGTLHLRVTSDKPAGHDPGSWPWLFGFDKDRLAPGETATVTGYIKVETPGEREFRVGLVATGSRFIDDNAFRTKITVTP